MEGLAFLTTLAVTPAPHMDLSTLTPQPQHLTHDLSTLMCDLSTLSDLAPHT